MTIRRLSSTPILVIVDSLSAFTGVFPGHAPNMSRRLIALPGLIKKVNLVERRSASSSNRGNPARRHNSVSTSNLIANFFAI